MAFTVTKTWTAEGLDYADLNQNFTDVETEIDSIEAIQAAQGYLKYQDLTSGSVGNVSSGTYKTVSITPAMWDQRSLRVKLAMDYVTSGGGTRSSQMVFGGTSITLASGGSSTIADRYYEVEFFKTQASDGSQTIAYRLWNSSGTGFTSAGEISSFDTSASNNLTITYTSSFTGGSASSSVLWIEVVSRE